MPGVLSSCDSQASPELPWAAGCTRLSLRATGWDPPPLFGVMDPVALSPTGVSRLLLLVREVRSRTAVRLLRTYPSSGNEKMERCWQGCGATWNPRRCWQQNARSCSVTQLCLTLCDPLTIAHQAPLSMGFPRWEYRSGCPFLLQGIFLMSGSNPCLLWFLHWQADSLPLSHQGIRRLNWCKCFGKLIDSI